MLARMMLIAALVQPLALARPLAAPAAASETDPQSRPTGPPAGPNAGLPGRCLMRDTLVRTISEKAGGIPVFVGMMGPREALEVWRDALHPGDTWIAFLSHADGVSCIVGTGNGMGFADPDKAPVVPGAKPA